MAKILESTGFHVKVYPDVRYYRLEADIRKICEEVAEQIRRHVDHLPQYKGNGVYVECDTEGKCEHCGDNWTEDSVLYNGGCCEGDVTDQERRGGEL